MKSKDKPTILDQPHETYTLGVRTSAWKEIGGFYLLMIIIAMIIGTNYNFWNVAPHPFWFIIILVAAQYGTIEGLVAAVVGSVIFIAAPIPERTILQDRYAYFFSIAKYPLLWFVTAVVLGELRMRHIRERDLLREAALQAAEKEKKIADAYDALKKIKERLEMKVVSEMQTTMAVINSFKHLEDTSKEGIIKGASELTQTLVSPEKFSIFFVENEGLKCVLSHGWDKEDRFLETIGPEDSLYHEVVDKKKSVLYLSPQGHILQKQGLLAVPIVAEHSKHVVGMIKIEQIPLLRLRTTAIETLRVIGTWVGKAYSNYLSKAEKR